MGERCFFCLHVDADSDEGPCRDCIGDGGESRWTPQQAKMKSDVPPDFMLKLVNVIADNLNNGFKYSNTLMHFDSLTKIIKPYIIKQQQHNDSSMYNPNKLSKYTTMIYPIT